MKRLVSGTLLLMFSSLLYAAPALDLWDVWDREVATNDQQVDHRDWQLFLDEFVVSQIDGVNRVKYQAAADSGRDTLDTYIDKLAEIDPRTLNKMEQMAYWINLYNALTVQVVLEYPKKKTILRMGERFLKIGPWDDEVVEIAGIPVTLNDIEHRILRPIWQDHRIHFAVNCASIGCPNLSKTAFTSENTETQLAAAEIEYLSHPRGVHVNDKGKVIASSIFDWYQSDFATNEKGVLTYLAKFSEPVAKANKKRRTKIDYEYDWSLNSYQNR